MRKRGLIVALCALTAATMRQLPIVEMPLNASLQPACDFLTGGGFIYPGSPLAGKGAFGVAGGCKHGSFWGHLEYQDHGMLVKVHGTSVTGYMVDTTVYPDPFARLICGTGRTPYGDVTWVVRAKEAGEAGKSKDEFDIQLQGATFFYTTFADGPHTLGGGNIYLHKPNSSNTGTFGGTCPPVIPGPPNPPPDVDLAVVKTSLAAQVSPQQPVIFDILVMASGATFTGVALTDVLPTRTAVVNPMGEITDPAPGWTLSGADAGMCTLTTAPDPTGLTNQSTLSCNFGTMPPGTMRSISVATTANANDLVVGSISNTATVTGVPVDTMPANNTSTATVTVAFPE